MDDSTTHPQSLPAGTHRRAELLIFAGGLAIYVLLAFLCHSDQLIWDEGRYLDGARNLSHGFFVPDDNPNFLNGPGYPLVLLPVVALDASLLWARILNGLFVALAGVLVFRTVRVPALPAFHLEEDRSDDVLGHDKRRSTVLDHQPSSGRERALVFR